VAIACHAWFFESFDSYYILTPVKKPTFFDPPVEAQEEFQKSQLDPKEPR
jgi:hypothetical protein